MGPGVSVRRAFMPKAYGCISGLRLLLSLRLPLMVVPLDDSGQRLGLGLPYLIVAGADQFIPDPDYRSNPMSVRKYLPAKSIRRAFSLDKVKASAKVGASDVMASTRPPLVTTVSPSARVPA